MGVKNEFILPRKALLRLPMPLMANYIFEHWLFKKLKERKHAWSKSRRRRLSARFRRGET